MKLLLLFSLLISLTSATKDKVPHNNKTIAPSADFIELTEVYKKRAPVFPENNAFIYLVGITAPENEDPMNFGQTMIDWSNKKVDNGGKNDSPEPKISHSLDKSYEALMQNIDCRMYKAAPCALASQQALARDAIDNNQWLLKRWHKLLDFSAYQNTLVIDLMTLSFPYYTNDSKLQRLALIDLWLNRNNYPPEYIEQMLQKDYDFHILLAANSTTLVDKMIAIVALRNNYYWLNEILNSVDNHTAILIKPDYLQQPIPPSVLSLKTTYAGELQLFISLFKPYNKSEDNPILYQFSDNDKQRLFNEQAKFLKKLINISKSADYQVRIKYLMEDSDVIQLLRTTKKLVEKYGGNWDEFNSSMGGYDFMLIYNAYFISLSHQLVAIQKAVNILDKVRQQGIKQDAISEFLNQPQYYNPLTQKPFVWDGDKKQIIIITENDKDTYYLSL